MWRGNCTDPKAAIGVDFAGRQAGATAIRQAVFLPQAEEIYADEFRFGLREKDLSRVLCGDRRGFPVPC